MAGPKKTTEKQYNRQLKKVARHSAHIVEGHVEGAEVLRSASMIARLNAYAEAITPWAKKQADKMLAQTTASVTRDLSAYSKAIGATLRAETSWGNLGITVRALQAEQVALIKSIPIEAGERAQRLALEAVTNGSRSAGVAQDLARTEEVTLSRATLIARTEVSKASSMITQSRAQSVGSTGYIWRTAEDRDVRDSHVEMNGEVVNWDSPPTLDGMTGHAGEYPNCRCYAEPIIN